MTTRTEAPAPHGLKIDFAGGWFAWRPLAGDPWGIYAPNGEEVASAPATAAADAVLAVQAAYRVGYRRGLEAGGVVS